MKNKILKIVISILIAGLILYYLFSQVDVDEMVDAFSNANLTYLFFGFFVYLIMNVNRAFRFKIFLKTKLKITEFMKIVFFHNFYLNLLPFRMGEFALLFQLKKRGIDLTKGFSSLSVVRIFDFFSYIICFFIFSLFLTDLSEFILISIRVIAWAMLFLVLGFIILIFAGEKILIAIRKFMEKKIPIKFIITIISKVEEIIREINKLKSITLLLQVIGTSIFNVILVVILTFMIVKSLGVDVSLLVVGLTQIASILFSVIPIQGFAALGTTEWIWTTVMMSFGVSKQLSFQSGFFVHIISLIYILILGFYAHIDEMLKKS
ncbi:flippase-like domain-containing protein [archaeon]|jgi:glycosyltransferase 2 family protein|nr:flippase-like domain-containing protein [archaeon]MBT4352333.1 flippase-like domain-containing protein [archaeon]MBT4647085.1 flippase-like domain-containing protein [archaeon]MBT6820994.1 flippase-like domain-containing protein [archaeon]MBT7392683.1 flippase-like domain-containing protein [archaeon]